MPKPPAITYSPASGNFHLPCHAHLVYLRGRQIGTLLQGAESAAFRAMGGRVRLFPDIGTARAALDHLGAKFDAAEERETMRRASTETREVLERTIAELTEIRARLDKIHRELDKADQVLAKSRDADRARLAAARALSASRCLAQ